MPKEKVNCALRAHAPEWKGHTRLSSLAAVKPAVMQDLQNKNDLGSNYPDECPNGSATYTKGCNAYLKTSRPD